MQVKKGEQFEWILEDKNTVWLRRVVPKPLRSAPKSQSNRFDSLPITPICMCLYNTLISR